MRRRGAGRAGTAAGVVGFAVLIGAATLVPIAVTRAAIAPVTLPVRAAAGASAPATGAAKGESGSTSGSGPASVVVDRDRGDFVARYVSPETPDYAIYHDQLRVQRFLESVADELNRALQLPADVTLRLAECGHSTTEWTRDTRTVTVCYEFLDAVVVIAGGGASSSEQAERLFSGAVTFALLAEVGRALVDVYGLAVDGTPAAAGDEFATVSLAAAERTGDPSAAAAVRFYDLALQTPDSGFEWLETHVFDRARLARVACLLYGNAPQNHRASVDGGLVPKAQAPRCGEDLLAVAKAWDARLGPHSKSVAAAR